MSKEKKRKKNWLALAFLVFMVIGMSSSFVFFGFGTDGKKKFKGDRWEAKINGAIAAFTFPPEQVSTMSMPPEASSLLAGKVQIDTTSSLNDTLKDAIALAQYQTGFVMGAYNVYVQTGYTDFQSNKTTFPAITCDKATSFVPVIYFEHSNQTTAGVENNCLVIRAKDAQDLLLMKDRLLYTMLGIV